MKRESKIRMEDKGYRFLNGIEKVHTITLIGRLSTTANSIFDGEEVFGCYNWMWVANSI